jgi:hypothetical protein
MTLPRSVADVLDEHVVFELESMDRLYLNLYQPKLAWPGGVVGFFRGHRGMPFASSALMDPISKDFVAQIHRYARQRGLDVVAFEKGQRKDDIAQGYLAGHDGSEGILFVGRAQEKTRVYRTEKRINPETGAAYPWLVTTTAIPNHFYFYGVDADMGPFFFKFCSYFPYTGKVCLNAHHYAQCQAAKAGIGFVPADNAFAACDDPAALQRICDRFSDAKIDRFVRKWLARLPHPFTTADRRAGYRYDISILQAEFSLTQVLDRPLAGRVFFEEVIRHNLDAGRPDQVSLTFQRRISARTPGRFRTRVLTDGVIPSIHADYKHSRIKQYWKQGVALRTETTINNTRDFGIAKKLPNLPALREIGFSANRRLLQVQRISCDPIAGVDTYQRVCQPLTSDGQRVPALRFDHPATQALLACLVVCRLLPNGFANRDLRALLAPALGLPARAMTQGRMSYHLRRLRLHGLIERIPHTHRYQITDFGLAAAVFLSRAYTRFIAGGMAHLDDRHLTGPDPPNSLRHAINRLDAELQRHARHSGLAA